MAQYKKENKGYQFILTCIDYFSIYVFAVGIKNKQRQTIINAMDDIVENQADDTYPK
jgi:hypothetical protein